MKKIININFHGRVIPIEETAFDILKEYIESLRRHFANEEGRDEIINDIENRFAELFSERLQKGSTCITDDDVNSIILSMGKPEDFEEDEVSSSAEKTYSSSQGSDQQSQKTEEPHRLFRSENDKILGGVCGGLAAYLRVDPAIVRIIFALITFGGFGSGLLLYIILWIVLPSKSIVTNIRKRLYRNPDNKVIAGVASGLAAYFHIDVWIPRLIFAGPFILGIITSIFRQAFHDWDAGPIFITGGFGGTLFITYIILWIVLPEANTASEKLEMRGEKVDLESIKNTIKSDLEGFKGRAGQMGDELKDKTQQFSKEVSDAARRFAAEAGPAASRAGSGIGHAIGVLFKAFFLFLAGIICFALIMVLIAVVFSGAGVFPFRYYVLTGFWQNFLAWTSFILFFCIPVIALIIWLIRRIMGVRTRNNYLGYAFGSLWTVGLICFIIFISMVVSNFRTRASMEDEPAITQPTNSKMLIRLEPEKTGYYGSDWFGFNWDEGKAPFYSVNADSIMMNTVRLKLAKSNDSEFHLHRIKFSRGNDPTTARNLAGQIEFNPRQSDSVLYLPQGFAITPNQKFRNQQVLMVLEVPVGKKVQVDGSLDDYKWFDINVNNRHRGYTFEWNDDWNDKYPYQTNVEYVMTETGLEKTHGRTNDNDEEQNGEQDKKSNKGYRYKEKADSVRPRNTSDKRTVELKGTANGTAKMASVEIIPRNEKSGQVNSALPVKQCSMKEASSESYSPISIFTRML
ncbi:MAG: hypothetical protein C5B59_18645 [Bacteroidetes bacterium]|nr:MAG: hypothetical protein C5B59_18645 [Bacteroidota bacterium]